MIISLSTHPLNTWKAIYVIVIMLVSSQLMIHKIQITFHTLAILSQLHIFVVVRSNADDDDDDDDDDVGDDDDDDDDDVGDDDDDDDSDDGKRREVFSNLRQGSMLSSTNVRICMKSSLAEGSVC